MRTFEHTLLSQILVVVVNLVIVAILSELSLRVLKRYKKPHVPAPTVAVSLPAAISKPPPLAFQILPMLIVYKTVEYLEGCSKYSIGLDMDKHNKSKAVLTPLLSVSERWRRAALESICDNCQSEHLQLYDSLISTLCQGGIKLLHAYSVRGTIPISLNLLGVSGLTSITNGVNIACAPFARLIYLNARTLKTIDFRVAAENNWRNMIFGFTETPAVYTRLTTLTLTVIGIPYESTWAAIDDVVPFPVLLTLHVGDMYPFDDDLLFRGNGRTMRNLRLPFRAIARNILARFNILKRSGVSRMSSVRIGNVYGMDVTFMAERADVILKQQVHHILETATKLKITRETSHMGIFNAIKLAPSTTILQHLDYGVFTRFCVATLRNLIAFLPSLVSLTCTLADRGLADRVTPESKYPSSLRSKNYPLSKNFRVLRVHHTTGASASTIAKISMLVAIACPNFSYVDMPSELRNPFSREIAWATSNRPFEPYADSIHRLIYKD
ncbi:hypothetical protein H4S03_002084 [Coemansia sp. S3946]|nr:hypothetical protein H4S03_002084 [Coemansia sp. S3946]